MTCRVQVIKLGACRRCGAWMKKWISGGVGGHRAPRPLRLWSHRVRGSWHVTSLRAPAVVPLPPLPGETASTGFTTSCGTSLMSFSTNLRGLLYVMDAGIAGGGGLLEASLRGSGDVIRERIASSRLWCVRCARHLPTLSPGLAFSPRHGIWSPLIGRSWLLSGRDER